MHTARKWSGLLSWQHTQLDWMRECQSWFRKEKLLLQSSFCLWGVWKKTTRVVREVFSTSVMGFVVLLKAFSGAYSACSLLSSILYYKTCCPKVLKKETVFSSPSHSGPWRSIELVQVKNQGSTEWTYKSCQFYLHTKQKWKRFTINYQCAPTGHSWVFL